MVWADSCRISRVRHYSGIIKGIFSFQVRDYNPLWSTFSSSFLKKIFYPSNSFWRILYNPTTPNISNDQNLTLMGFGLFPVRSSLLRESHYDFFSSCYWDISLHTVVVIYDILVYRIGCPIRKSPVTSGYWHLAEAFRSQSRPSSTFLPKASIFSL